MGEETRTEMRDPMLLPHAVEVADGDTEDAAHQLVRVPIRRPQRRVKRPLDRPFMAVARGGGRLAYVDAPSYEGCGSRYEDEEELEPGLVEGSCRIVLAGRGARTYPVELVAERRTAEPGGGWRIEGRLLQRGDAGARPVTGRQLAILTAEQAGDGIRYPATGPQVTTGPDGRWSFSLPPASDVRYVGAVTIDRPRTWLDEVFLLPAAP